MNWMFLIFLSAFFLACYDLAKKASVRKNAVLCVLLCSSSSGAAAFLLMTVCSGSWSSMFHLPPLTYWLAAVKSVIVATSWVFTFCALRTLPISIATPIRASAPALVFVFALFLYSEVPTLLQAFGMLLTFLGYLFFSRASQYEGIHFLHSRAVGLAFAGALFSAGASLFDKFCLQYCNTGVEPLQFWFQIFLVCFYALALGIQRLFHVSSTPFHWRWTIPFVGILLACADWLYFTAVATPQVPISIAALMRRASVVMTFFLGAWLFHERNICRKALALSLILIGLTLLCFST